MREELRKNKDLLQKYLYIAERKRIEEEREQAELFYRTLFNESPDGVLIVDPHTTKILEFNDKACKQLGYTRQEFKKLRIADFEAKESPKNVKAHIEKIMRKGDDTFETLHRRKDGEVRNVFVRIRKINVLGKDLFLDVYQDVTERRKTEEELRENEIKFRLAFENAQDAILWADTKTGVLINCNKAAEKLFEKPKSQIIGQHQMTLHPPEAQKYCREVFKKQTLGIGSGAEIPIITKSGKIKTVTISSSVVEIKEERIIQGIFRDVSERKRIGDALRESEERYRHLVTASPDAILVHSRGKIKFVNPAGVKLFGETNKRKLLDKPVLSIVAKEFHAIVKRRIHQAEKGQTPLIEMKFVRLDGSIFDGDVTGRAVVYQGLPAIQIVIRDITVRKEAEDALRRAKLELEFIVAQRTTELRKANRRANARNMILRLISTKSSRKEYIDSLIEHLEIWSGCRCIGIRILDEEGRIPYESYIGFSHEFWESENWLSVKEDQCACIRVVKGKPEREDLPVMTGAGSFYSNNMGKFIAGLTGKEKAKFRGYCAKSGFNSMAVIPISYKEKIIGAIHFADEKEGAVQLNIIELIEFAAPLIGEGIHKFNLEDKIKQGHAILDAFFKHTVTPFVFFDRELNFIRVNEAYAKVCQRDASEFIGKNHFKSYHDPENERIFRQVVESKIPFQAFAKPFMFSDRHERGVTYWDWTLVPILDKNGEVEFLALSLNNVTERKLAEETLSMTKKELESARRLSDIGILAATVAHELRNPLGVIRTAAYNIKRKAQNPSLDSHLANIEKKILESDQIIGNLLFYSRLKTPHYETVRIHDIFKECIKSARTRFSEYNVTVINKIGSLRKDFIDADPVQMSELVSNILNNAYDACVGKTCTIEIRGRKDRKSNIEMIFKDDGAGMDGEQLKRVFEPFFTTKARGTGLGLTVCNQIVSLHGGKICIESKKGKGTMVTVTIPIKRKINGKENLSFGIH